MGITVFSVPGNIFDPNFVGTNKLIKAGAIPVLNTEDITEEYSAYLSDVEKPEPGVNFIGNGLHGGLIKKKSPDQKPQKKQQENEKKIMEIIISAEKISVDEIIRKSGFNAVKVNSMLPLLEIEGHIKKQAGNFYTAAES